MKLSEKIEAIQVTLFLFPRCARCGQDISTLRFGDLMTLADRPNRFAHRVCPEGTDGDR